MGEPRRKQAETGENTRKTFRRPVRPQFVASFCKSKGLVNGTKLPSSILKDFGRFRATNRNSTLAVLTRPSFGGVDPCPSKGQAWLKRSMARRCRRLRASRAL